MQGTAYKSLARMATRAQRNIFTNIYSLCRDKRKSPTIQWVTVYLLWWVVKSTYVEIHFNLFLFFTPKLFLLVLFVHCIVFHFCRWQIRETKKAHKVQNLKKLNSCFTFTHKNKKVKYQPSRQKVYAHFLFVLWKNDENTKKYVFWFTYEIVFWMFMQNATLDSFSFFVEIPNF